MAEGHDGSLLPASCSPPSPRRCSSTQTVDPPLWPPWSDRQPEPDEDPGMQTGGRRSSRLYEELYCSGRASIPLVPLTRALVTSSGPQSDVVKRGYLGKLERNHRRYFVLRAGSHTGPSRLEWYKSQEKFTAVEKSAGKASMFGPNKQGVIYLRCCLGVSRVGSSRKGHAVALYAKDQTMALVTEDQQEQEEWYVAIKKLMEEEQKDEEYGDGVDEEDDGYCTLPPAAFFKEVWPVTVKPRDLGSCKSLTGENRLCLTATSLVLVKVGAGNDLPSVTIPLLSVRRFGHLNGLFFLELGRSAPNGPGEIWMEARDQGNPVLAQHIHEAVREAVRALRALPDFSRSPTYTHNQPLASKRCRPKYRDKLVNVRPPGPLGPLPRNPDIQTNPAQRYPTPSNKPGSSLSFTSRLSPSRAEQSSGPETSSYMEMKTDHCRSPGWEPAEEEEEEEEEEEGPGYMIMSPQVGHSSSVVALDDYMTMASPHKHERPSLSSSSSSSLQTSFNSSASDSPLHPSHHRTAEQSRSHWLVDSVQRSETTSCSHRPQDDARQQQNPTQPTATSPSVGRVHTSDPMTTSATSGPESPRLYLDTGQSSPLQDQSAVRRSWMSLCLLSCLQAENRP